MPDEPTAEEAAAQEATRIAEALASKIDTQNNTFWELARRSIDERQKMSADLAALLADQRRLELALERQANAYAHHLREANERDRNIDSLEEIAQQAEAQIRESGKIHAELRYDTSITKSSLSNLWEQQKLVNGRLDDLERVAPEKVIEQTIPVDGVVMKLDKWLENLDERLDEVERRQDAQRVAYSGLFRFACDGLDEQSCRLTELERDASADPSSGERRVIARAIGELRRLKGDPLTIAQLAKLLDLTKED